MSSSPLKKKRRSSNRVGTAHAAAAAAAARAAAAPVPAAAAAALDATSLRRDVLASLSDETKRGMDLFMGVLDVLSDHSFDGGDCAAAIVALEAPVLGALFVQASEQESDSFVLRAQKMLAFLLKQVAQKTDGAVNLLRACLRPSDTGGDSIMQVVAEFFQSPLAENVNAMDFGLISELPPVNPMDPTVDMLHEAYCCLADADGQANLDWDTVVVPYTDYCDDVLHPGPPENAAAVQIDGFPVRMSIVIAAHGSDLVDDVYDTPMKTPAPFEEFMQQDTMPDTTVMFYGPGVCAASTYTSRDHIESFERAVWEATRPHQSNTLETMQSLRPQLCEMYKKDLSAKHAGDAPIAARIAAGEHCRIVRPYLNRGYTYIAGGTLRMVQCFNSPYNDLVGRPLLGPEMRRRMREHHPHAAAVVQLILDEGLVDYRGRLRLYSSPTEEPITLDMIGKIVHAMGFKVLNVYDYCCRNLEDALNGEPFFTSPDRHRKHVERITAEEEVGVRPRAYGGGGGGGDKVRKAAARTRRRARVVALAARVRRRSSRATQSKTTTARRRRPGAARRRGVQRKRSH